ncbi:hypothetical protein BDM02DRAFT_3114698 [Thelephora ganbajun]|uniref:Uncharacterized protein n=1 Tax=Thelephora ganbajun TaxID=370292 RepID=A0ACB6ZHB2_THEGA|nr:hypothetical protein BDM02DRAFT_3114698 [Thelephora ganbajun]
MKRLFGKKPKKSPKPSPKPVSPGIPANVASKPLAPDDEGNNRGSRVVFQDNSGEDKGPPAPGVSTSGVAVIGTDHRSDPPSKCL